MNRALANNAAPVRRAGVRSGAVLLVMVALMITACSGDDRDEVLVFAASSLTDTFAEIETAFEAEHPTIDVVLNIGGSSALREQITRGAPADAFASANAATMAQVVGAIEPTGTPVAFASNSMTIVVPAGNPGDVQGVESFANPELTLGACAPGVPCGDAASTVFRLASVSPKLDTEEPSVRALLSKVMANELDAGLVYDTDAVFAGSDVETIPVPDAVNVEVAYLIVNVGAGSGTSTDTDSFVDFVVGPQGQAILSAHGFQAP